MIESLSFKIIDGCRGGHGHGRRRQDYTSLGYCTLYI